MTSAKLNLHYINDVREIVNAATGMPCEIDLISGRYVIDAKSIMGIFSLDFEKPIQVKVHGTPEQAEEFFKKIGRFLIRE